MLERIHEIPGVLLGADEYLDDFWPNFRKIDDVFWKLERVQSFREPNEPSWVAMLEGDWDRSMKLVDGRSGVAGEGEGRVERFSRRRIRIVEQPVTPYVQWEMHVLALREAAAEQVRVLDSRRGGRAGGRPCGCRAGRAGAGGHVRGDVRRVGPATAGRGGSTIGK